MVRKVDLDLLEETEISGTEGELKENEAAPKKGWRWLTGRKLIVTALLSTFFCVVCISLVIFSVRKDSPIESGSKLTEVRIIPDNIEILDNFIIDLLDERGRYRVLVCDIALVMGADKNISANKLDTRKKAYDALKAKGKYALVSSKSYSIIRKEMRDELDRLLGGGIKEVYFTKFVLL